MMAYSSAQVLKLWGMPMWGGGSCLYEEHIYFERNVGVK
jgi:hypothetical protein